ncbi:DUF4142 domain-containing protein [Deinococcus aquiradiocola]|uniref:DUF4142 domain-containing protein n=1 Tax=Deinococcus aquiradiocola TaxID=393059 RepID=A0A917UKX8_9DEIO|nr:DUF4142 domain-containing protein [Deinococcus aquiradiocola]GGJ65204.1 hypothetical protein GCM10008939_06390 [Deinococcus aquiradiocola]
MKNALVLTALVIGTTASAAMMLTTTDEAFVPKAAMGNQFELEAAKMAETMSMDAKVKSYAAKMITDHTKLGAQVKAAVMKADPKMMVPAKVSPAQQKMLDALKASGKNFDTLYKKDMVASHAETYALFQKYAMAADANAGLKMVIKAALPTVKMHLDMAKGLPTMSM